MYSNNRFKITFSNNRDYIYSTDNVRYYKYISTKENVCIYEKGKRNKAYNIVDNYGRYLIFRNNNSQSEPVYNNRDIEICELRTNFNQIGRAHV